MAESFLARFEAVLGDLDADNYKRLVAEGDFRRWYSPMASKLERTITALQDFLRVSFDAWLKTDTPQEEVIQDAIWFLDDGELRESVMLIDSINDSLRDPAGELQQLLEGEASVVAADLERLMVELLDNLAKTVNSPIPLLAEAMISEISHFPQTVNQEFEGTFSTIRKVGDKIWAEGPTTKNVETFLSELDPVAKEMGIRARYWHLRETLVDEQNDLEVYELWRVHT